MDGLTELLKQTPDVDLNDEDEYGQTPASWAAEKGHAGVVKILIGRSADVNAVDNGLRGPLHWAAESGDIETVRLLVEAGGDLSAKDSKGLTPVLWAANNANAEIVEFMLEKRPEDLNTLDNRAQGPLHLTAKFGKADTVQLPIDKDADLDLVDSEYNQTPISWAAGNGYLEVVRKLAEAGADINIPDVDNGLPLNIVSINNHEDVVLFLLSKVSKDDHRDKSGRSQLSWAAEYPSLERVVEDLTSSPLYDVHDQDGVGRTALHYAARGGHVESIKTLLGAGAKPESRDKFGQIPLTLAAREGHLGAVELLMEHESDISSQDEDGYTALLEASSNGHLECVQALLGLNPKRDLEPKDNTEGQTAHPNPKLNLEHKDNIEGETALGLATTEGHLEVVKLLVEPGCDIYSRDSTGRTIVSYAVEYNEPEVLETMIEHSCKNGCIRTHAAEEAIWYRCSWRDEGEAAIGNESYLGKKDKDGRRVLSWAAERGDMDELRLLAKKDRN